MIEQAGLIIRTFTLPAVTTDIYKGKIQGVTKDQSKIGRLSKLGTPIFSDLQFTATDIYGNGEVIQHIPVDTVLFTVRQEKKIVETDVAGRDDAITEYIGKSKYIINIKGVIASGKPGVYPWDEVMNLRAFLDYEQSLGINSAFLNDIFGVSEIVIFDYDVPQLEGEQSQQRFEISCKSERPVEVLISEAD